MKKFFLKPLLAISLVAVVLMSCSDDSDDEVAPDITAPVGKISAKISGASFEATGGAQISNNEILLGGNVGNEALSIIITKGATTGTYDVKGAPVGITPDAEINYTSNLGSNLYSSIFAPNGTKVGTVTVTEIDEANKTISGTFSSTVSLENGTSKEITGSFNKVPYVTAAASTLTAKIDGQAFTSTVAVGANAQGAIAVNGQALNGSKIIMVSFNDDIVPGTYPIGEPGMEDAYATYTVGMDIFMSTTGSLTITKHDKTLKRVEGSFSFTAEPFLETGTEHTITQGTFAITYH